MKFSQCIVGLIAAANAVSAIDIILYETSDTCDKTWTRWFKCSGINPGTCCVYGKPESFRAGSILFDWIPSNWRINPAVFDQQDCKKLVKAVQTSGETSWCFKNGHWGGGRYSFVNKRGVPDEPTSCQAADTLGLADGTEFNLVGLDDKTSEEIWNLTANVTTIDQVPEHLRPLAFSK